MVKNSGKGIQLIGISVILVAVLAYVYTFNYEPEYEEHPFGEVISSSKRYKSSAKAGWHKIDFSTFSIEVPKDYRFYLEEGMHGGKVGGLTNARDTIAFAYGAYYFDACEGTVLGEIEGACDTLKVLSLGSAKLIVVKTDSHISAYADELRYGHVFKTWAKLNMDQEFLMEVFKTVEIK